MEEKLRSFYRILLEVIKEHLNILVDLDKREAFCCDESGRKLSDEEYRREHGKSPTEQTWKELYNDLWKSHMHSDFWREQFHEAVPELRSLGFEVGVDYDPPDAFVWSLLLKINNKWLEVGIAYRYSGPLFTTEAHVERIYEPQYVLSNWEKLEKVPKKLIQWI